MTSAAPVLEATEVTGLIGVREFGPLVARPRQPSDRDVVVDVEAVAICGSDLLGYLGRHPRIRPPSILGHELAGTVRWTGAGVAGVQPGDVVAVDPTFGCGSCRFCSEGRWNICRDYIVLGETDDLPGGTAGTVVVPGDHVHRLPPGIDASTGAVVQPIAVAYHAVAHRARVVAGETVVVIGGGAIGLGVLMAATDAGARTIVVDTLDYRLELARALGADRTINAQQDVVAAVLDATDGYGADAVFEAVGAGQDHLFEQGLASTARGGRLVVVGLKSPSVEFDLGALKWGEKAILGSQAHPHAFGDVIERVASGAFPAERLISHRVPWNDLAGALGLLEQRAEGVVKVVLTRQSRQP